ALSARGAALPAGRGRLLAGAKLLEREHGDIQDIEFTVERDELWLLQTRAAKRSPEAAVRAAVDLTEEGAIDRAEALQRVTPEQLATVLAPRVSAAVEAPAAGVARGVAACPGGASGGAVRDSDAACEAAGDVALARPTTSPEDVSGMLAARAVVTERGGSTSHAAVVTRALGRPSVVGVGEGVTAELVGEELTVDGSAGVVYRGILETEEVDPATVPGLETLIGWAREASPVEVIADAGEGSIDPEAVGTSDDVSTPEGARAAIEAGAARVRKLPG